MPQATKEDAIGVRLDLTNSKPNYEPGDTLNGYVVWSSPQIGFVRIRLSGRVKTKIERKQATRGRAILFDLEEVLYNGPPCKNGQQAKPFSLIIPTTVRKDVKARGNDAIWGGNKLGVKDEWLESAAFLSTANNKGDTPLPFSYYYNAANMGVSAEAFVEYVLRAETAFSEQASKYEASLRITSLPLILRMPRAAEIEMGTRRFFARALPGAITAHSTDVDFDKSKLTFRHKMKKTFRSSSFPRFGFDVVVSTPTHIQLDDQRPFPFRVSLFPNLLPIQTNVCPDGDVSKIPIVRVTSLKLKLRSTTLIRCPSSWMDDESDTHEYNFNLLDPIDYAIPVGGLKNASKAGFEIPVSRYTTGTPSSPVEFLDLGDILKLRLTPLKTEAQGRMSEQLPRPIWPSFKTFSINVSYDFMYEMKVECLGEKETVSNYHFAHTNVVVLAPAHDNNPEMKTKQGDIDAVGLAMAAGGFANQMLSAFVPGWPF